MLEQYSYKHVLANHPLKKQNVLYLERKVRVTD